MSFGVVYADEGDILCIGECFCGLDADEEGADEAGAFGDSDAVDIIFGESCFVEGASEDFDDIDDVCAAGEFWYDAAIFCVERDLACDDMGQDFAIFDDGSRTLVTRAFNTEYFHNFFFWVETKQ